MRKKNWYVILLCLVPLLGMMSCSDDEELFGIDEITQQAFSSGIDVPADGSLVVLSFNKDDKEWRTELQFHSDDQNWCSAELRPDTETCSIELTITANTAVVGRKATLQVISGNVTHAVVITQEAAKLIVPHRKAYYMHREGGKLDVTFDASVPFTHRLQFNGNEWIDYESTEQKETACTLHFKVAENKGLGRSTTLYIEDTEDSSKDIQIEITQEPRLFGSKEEMNGLKEGQLAIAIGSDAGNYSRIETLSIDGALNKDDMDALRKLLATSSGSRLKNLDMRTARIYSPVKDRMPDGLFSNNKRIESVKLSVYITDMGNKTFEYCMALKEVVLPADLKRIGDYAFYNCENLSEIVIPKEASQLQSIGQYAFSTGSRIECITLPATVTDFDGHSLHGDFKELHVRWETPPALKRSGSKKNTILYVPVGTADLYRNAEYWNQFADVVEEEVE